MPEQSVEKSTVLITGAAKRIGRAIAVDMARHGWAVAIHYNTSAKAAKEAVEEIRDNGGSAAALQADLEDLDAVRNLLPACAEALETPRCLINNASLFEQDGVSSLSPDSFHRHMRINLRAPVFLAQAFAANLVPPAEGTIINILDQRVWKLTPDYFSYTISKAGLWTATQTMAQALSPRIRVNAIGPGPTLANTRQSEAVFAKQQQATPLGRGAELREICSAVRFILDAPSMTGQMIALDGGQHLAWRTPDVTDADE
ncbi:MAG: SDR family oxidoreductase [Hyphomicrobiales bacterium]|nr:SDR family oxidoreductase [Hyphomicrobiales bacterium]